MDDMAVYQGLLHKGIIIRPVANYELPGFLRVSVGTMAENQAFIAALEQVIS